MEDKIITIGLSRSTLKFPLFSWGIMLWESIYHTLKDKKITIVKHSHCYLKFDTSKIFEIDTVYHAAKSMIHYIPYDTFLENNKLVEEFNIKVSYEIYKKIRIKLHKNLGKKYGHLQNLGILITDIVELITKKDQINPFKKGYNCSEAAAEVLVALKPELADVINFDRVKTHKIHELLEEHF